MRKIILFAAGLLFMSPVDAEAQILRKLGEKIEERVENRVDRKQREQEAKVDNKIDRSIDQILNAPEEAIEDGRRNRNSTPNAASANDMMAMMREANDIELQSSYQFDRKLTYEFRENQSRPEQMSYLLSKNNNLYAMESGRDLIVYDFDNNAIITISDRDKSIQVLSMDMIRNFGSQFGGSVILPEDEEEQNTDFTFAKIPGATQTIAGVKSEKYVFSDEDTSGEMWFSDQVDIDIIAITQKLMGAFSTNYAFPTGGNTPFETMFMMKTTTVDRQTGDTTEMTVVNIEDKSTTINTGNYKRNTF